MRTIEINGRSVSITRYRDFYATKVDEAPRTRWLEYIGSGEPGCHFPPDRVSNVRTDLPDGISFSVVDRNGVPICGRVCDTYGGTSVVFVLEDWEWMTED